jgi:hypothetical protein
MAKTPPFFIFHFISTKGHLFIGYKLYKQAPVLNPKLDTLIKFGPKDSIIVVSED